MYRNRIVIFLLTFLVITSSSFAENIFIGMPIVKISEAGITRISEKLNKQQADNYQCIIVQEGDKYYWASRQNVELAPLSVGAFTTYIALNGSGLIRIIDKEYKDMASLMSDTEFSYDYIEFLMIGLRTITYYGKAIMQY